MYDYESNESMANQQTGAMFNPTVPNVMTDEPQPMQGIEIQQGSLPYNGVMPQGGEMYQPNNSNMLPLYGMEEQKPPFTIPDELARRTLVTKIFLVLLLQNIIMLPVMELFLLCTDEPMSVGLYAGVWLLMLGVFYAFYCFSESRRYAPLNIAALAVVTILMALQEGIYATQIGSRIAFLSKLVVIVQLICLIAYIRQHKFRVSNINSILLITLVFGAYVAFLTLLAHTSAYLLTIGSILHAVYYVYDTQLMMSGHHEYNLQPEEFIFAATNIYADLPNLLWRFFRFTFLDHFIRLYNFFGNCCAAEVC